MAAAPASAVTVSPFEPFSSFHVFGDSLSDNGNVYKATFKQIPKSSIYWNGRFTNGPAWSDHIAEDFKALGRRADNYAFGGAAATGYNVPVPDLGDQVSAFEWRNRIDNRMGARPLAAVWAGANDLFSAIGKNDAVEAGRAAADAVGDALESLVRIGVGDIIVFNLPDLGEIPRYHDQPLAEEATAGTLAFNAQLEERLDEVRETGQVNIYFIDMFWYFNDLLENPEAYGVSDVRTPCVQGGQVCTPEEAIERAFYDTMHPNAAMHAAIADVVRAELEGPGLLAAAQMAQVAPVPLPAPALLIIGGIAILGLVGRRRAAGGAASG